MSGGEEEGWTNKHQGGQGCLAWPRAGPSRTLLHLSPICVFEKRKVEICPLWTTSSVSVCLPFSSALAALKFNLIVLRHIRIYDLRKEARLSLCMARFALIAPKQPKQLFSYCPYSPHCSSFIAIPEVTSGQQLKSFKQPQSMQSHFEGPKCC